MKLIIIFAFFLFLTNCSLNKDSKFWTEDEVKKKKIKKNYQK